MDRITQFVAWAMLSIALFPIANPAAYSVTLYANVLNANTQITANVLTFNGISYASNTLFVSNTLLAAEANYPVNAMAVPGFAFAGWTATTNISLSSPSLPNAIATITGNGILTGEYDAVSNVVFAYNGGAEGGVFLNGTSYPNGASNTIPNGDYPVNAVVGSGFVFSNWTAEGANAIFSNATAANTFVNISGNVVITANFATANIPSPSPYPTVPTTNEPNLSIILTNSSFLNNSQLNKEPFFNVTPVLHPLGTINISENVPYGIIESNGVNVPANTNRYYVLFNGSTYSLYHLHVVKAIPNLSITVYGKTYTDPQYGDVFVQVPRNDIKNGAYSLPIGISSALLPNNIADFTYSVNITNLAYNILPSNIGSNSINAQGISKTFNLSSIPVNEMIKITFDTSGNANYSSLDPVVYVSPNYNNLVYSANTQLGSDVVCGNLTVDSGVTLTTNGFNILCINTITNDGLLQAGDYLAGGAGSTVNTAPGAVGANNPSSYGGSGGGGGSGGSGAAGNDGTDGGDGGNTLVAGGAGALYAAISDGLPGASGSTPPSPAVLDNANIITWYTGGFQNYISAASGGGGGAGYKPGVGGDGGASSFGIYIQANDIIAGNIVASGGAGAAGGTGVQGGGGGGGGGGGIILLAYGPGGYTSGTYNFAGGAGGAGGLATGGKDRIGGAGGAGGNGNVLTYSWTTPPITIIPASLFTETGLPASTTWNVIYNSVLNSSSTNTVLFLNVPGSYAFTVANQVVSGSVYVPSPASGSVVAGNTTAITFTQPSCTISLSTNSIDFGNINPNADMSTSNEIIDSNGGSAGGYMYAYGGNWIGTSSSNTFYVANTLWNPSTSGSLIGNQLLPVSSNTEIYLPPSSSNNIYFGVGVPPGQTADSYSQNITILNEC